MIKRMLAFTLALLLAAGVAHGEVTTAFGGLVRIDGEERIILPQGLCRDAEGRLIITDTANHCVLRALDGGLELIAGSLDARNDMGRAIAGYLDTDAKASLFSSPVDAALLPSGMLLISDGGNGVLRVLWDGRMYTFSGAGGSGYANGDKREAMYSLPSGIAVAEDGTVYVADTLNHCIRAVTAEGAATLLCGQNGVAGFKDGALRDALFCEPQGLALGADGALYISDSGNHRIRRLQNGRVTTVAGGGERARGEAYAEGGFTDGDALTARLRFPSGLCFDARGTLYIADTGNHAVRALTSDGRLATVAGTGEPGYADGAPTAALFNSPTDVCIIGSLLYIADSLNRAVRVMLLSE